LIWPGERTSISGTELPFCTAYHPVKIEQAGILGTRISGTMIRAAKYGFKLHPWTGDGQERGGEIL
jgi:hypothetical protein